MKPKAYDLFCGLGGWSDGLIAAGYDVTGFDIEEHSYKRFIQHPGNPTETVIDRYPGNLVIRDVLEIHGSELADATVLVASPPCQKYSWLAMPWSRSTDPENSKAAKALRKEWETNGPDNRLFDACFRIQREAIEASTQKCDCIVWGQVCRYCAKCGGTGEFRRYIPLIVENVRGAQEWVGISRASYGSFHLWGDVEQVGNRIQAGPDIGKFGRGLRVIRQSKVPSESGRITDPGKGARFTSRDCGIEASGTKVGGDWFRDPACHSRYGSKSPLRKMEAAKVARIPPALSDYVAQALMPAKSESA